MGKLCTKEFWIIRLGLYETADIIYLTNAVSLYGEYQLSVS